MTFGIAQPMVAMPSTSTPAIVSSVPSSSTVGGSSTSSRSQLRETFILSKLREKALIVVREIADVRDAGHDHRQAVEAKAEGEAGVTFRIERAIAAARIHRLEHRGIDHAAASDLEPFVRGAERGGFDTVSYTHLRAHETPEHLVCRLLL